jgi:hypothetical protein
MKRLLTGVMCLALLAAMVIPAAAQGRRERYYRGGDGYGRQYNTYGYNGYYRDRRSYWDRHRDKTTVAIGTGVGAAIGGLAGGGRGAVIGALVGAGSSALYTYRLRDRYGDRRYYGSYGNYGSYTYRRGFGRRYR